MNKVYNKYCWKTYNWVFIISKNIKLVLVLSTVCGLAVCYFFHALHVNNKLIPPSLSLPLSLYYLSSVLAPFPIAYSPHKFDKENP